MRHCHHCVRIMMYCKMGNRGLKTLQSILHCAIAHVSRPGALKFHGNSYRVLLSSENQQDSPQSSLCTGASLAQQDSHQSSSSESLHRNLHCSGASLAQPLNQDSFGKPSLSLVFWVTECCRILVSRSQTAFTRRERVWYNAW